MGLLRAAAGLSQTSRQVCRAAPIRISSFARSVPPPLWAVLDQKLCGIVTQLSGDLFGSAALIFTNEDADNLGRKIIEGMERREALASREMAASAIEEMGNIFLNLSLAPLSNEHGLTIFSSAPALIRGSFDKIWHRLSVAQAAASEILLLYFHFTPSPPHPT